MNNVYANLLIELLRLRATADSFTYNNCSARATSGSHYNHNVFYHVTCHHLNRAKLGIPRLQFLPPRRHGATPRPREPQLETLCPLPRSTPPLRLF